MRPRIILIFMAFIFGSAALTDESLAGESSNPVEIREWKIPAGGRSRDPFAFSKDAVWFVGQAGDYLGRLNPETGDILIRDLKDEPGPHNLIVGANGIVWYSGNHSGYIGRYDPKADRIEKIKLPDAADDPHTLVFDRDQKNIWFTAQNANLVGRLSVADRKVDIIPSPAASSRPYGIIVAPDGAPWIALFGANRIIAIDPADLKAKSYTLPEGARPRRIDASDDGAIWYTDYRRGYLGRIEPKSGALKEWRMPSGDDARPYGMAVDAENRIWFVETGVSPNRFVGFEPESEQFFSITPIPSGAGSVRHMHYQKETGQVWFGTDEDTIGRAQVIRR